MGNAGWSFAQCTLVQVLRPSDKTGQAGPFLITQVDFVVQHFEHWYSSTVPVDILYNKTALPVPNLKVIGPNYSS